MSRKKAFITGITGQDGSYLAELLLSKDYVVHGLVRRSSSLNRQRLERAQGMARLGTGQLFLHYGDLCDSSSLSRLVSEIQPNEIYNLGAQSHVKVSFEAPESTADVDAMGVLRLLEAMRANTKDCRFYQASTSELFGKVAESPQSENTPFYPRSPYGVAKLYSYWLVKNYREAYGIHASNGILFNHESPRRGENFVTRKITLTIASMVADDKKVLTLGNLNARRDWGYAKDYVEMMWLMLQQDQPDDYVAATGECHTVREFVEVAARYAGFEIQWTGSGVDERGVDTNTGRELVRVSPDYFRPTEVELLVGDASKAREQLGWQPRTTFYQLVEKMMKADLLLCGLAPSTDGKRHPAKAF